MPPFLTPKHEAIQYDGTNGEYIATEWLTDVGFDSDDGQKLTVQTPSWPGTIQQEIPLGYYVFRYGDHTYYQYIPAATYAQLWTEIPVTGGA